MCHYKRDKKTKTIKNKKKTNKRTKNKKNGVSR